jgi:hypothetical protein
MFDGDWCVLLNFFPMANWVKMLDVGENEPSHKCDWRNVWILSDTDSTSALLFNPNSGHGSDGTATSNIINRLIHNIPAKMGV